jgi:hypothetical protein
MCFKDFGAAFAVHTALVAVHFNFSPLREHCFPRGRMLRRAKSLSTATALTKKIRKSRTKCDVHLQTETISCVADDNKSHYTRDSCKENLNWTIREQCACAPRGEHSEKHFATVFSPALP